MIDKVAQLGEVQGFSVKDLNIQVLQCALVCGPRLIGDLLLESKFLMLSKFSCNFLFCVPVCNELIACSR